MLRLLICLLITAAPHSSSAVAGRSRVEIKVHTGGRKKKGLDPAARTAAAQLLHVYDDRLVFESTDRDGCLVVERGSFNTEDGSPLCETAVPVEEAVGVTKPQDSFPIVGIYGVYALPPPVGPVLVVMRASEPVLEAAAHHMQYERVTKLEVIPLRRGQGNEKSPEATHQLDMLCGSLAAHDLFFSRTPTADVTHTMQRTFDMRQRVAASAPWQCADRRFFWNRRVSSFLQAAGAHEWVLPVMNGFIDVRRHASGDGSDVTLVLISRRSAERQGTRLERRGLDEEGNVANFVETEQCVLKEDGTGQAASYVQIRGSIPLFWGHPPHMRCTPRQSILPTLLDWADLYPHQPRHTPATPPTPQSSPHLPAHSTPIPTATKNTTTQVPSTFPSEPGYCSKFPWPQPSCRRAALSLPAACCVCQLD